MKLIAVVALIIAPIIAGDGVGPADDVPSLEQPGIMLPANDAGPLGEAVLAE
jgi:hypothetical protein